MAKSQQSFNKKEKEKKRIKKRQDKEQKRKERKETPKRSGLENMLAYVDENGQLTDTPPDPSKKKLFKAENIELGVPKFEPRESLSIRKGVVEFFNDSKGFGFIKELDSAEKFFCHVSGLLEEVSENDKVTFEVEHGLKGMNAVRVKKI